MLQNIFMVAVMAYLSGKLSTGNRIRRGFLNCLDSSDGAQDLSGGGLIYLHSDCVWDLLDVKNRMLSCYLFCLRS